MLRTLSNQSAKLVLALALPTLAFGCGGSGGPEMAKVSGKVTYQGKPLTKGTISFVSTDPNRANANSVIGPDGSYSLQTTNPNDGAVLGEYRVIVSDIDPNALNTPAPGEPVKKQERTIPEKYENPETSGLTRKVEKGSNTFDIALE